MFTAVLHTFGNSAAQWDTVCTTGSSCSQSNEVKMDSVSLGGNKGPWGSYLRAAVLVLTCGKVVGKSPRWHRDCRLEEEKNREEEEKKPK